MIKKIGRKISHYYSSIFDNKKTLFTSTLALSDYEFLSKFNICEVQEQLEKLNEKKAKDSLVEYYHERTKDKWVEFPIRITDAVECDKQEVMRVANSLINYHFEIGDEPEVIFEQKINWKFNPTGDPRARWTRELHRHRWLPFLIIAYNYSKDTRFLKFVCENLTDWIKNNRPPKYKDENNVAWALMGVGMRSVVWTSMFATLCQSKIVSDSFIVLFLKSLYDHAHFLSLYKTHSNHLLRESNGLAFICTYFKEFDESQHWENIAFSRLINELDNQINDDGSHYEMSSTYQRLVLDEFQASYELLCKSDDIRNRELLREKLISMYRYLGYMLFPDGTLPQLGDGFMEKGSVLNKIENAGESFGKKDLIYIGSMYKKGVEPEINSIEFKNAGRYIFRNGWRLNSNYLSFNKGPHGGFHGHEDKLSIEVCSGGKPFIIDPGTYTYNELDRYREYFMSSSAHNLIIPDGKSQIRRFIKKDLSNKSFVCDEPNNIWINSDELDYISGIYNEGYAEYSLKRREGIKVTDSMVHQRHILNIKPYYWVIFDELNNCKINEKYLLLFHLMPGIDVNKIDNNELLLIEESTNATLQMSICSNAKIKLSNYFGEEDPIRGWYSNGTRNHKVPTSTIVCEISTNVGQCRIATLLVPGNKSHISKTLFEYIEGNNSEENIFKITHGNTNDQILFSSSEKEKFIFDYSTCANIFLLRTNLDYGNVSNFSYKF